MASLNPPPKITQHLLVSLIGPCLKDKWERPLAGARVAPRDFVVKPEHSSESQQLRTIRVKHLRRKLLIPPF